jgi:hypothetical protein
MNIWIPIKEIQKASFINSTINSTIGWFSKAVLFLETLKEVYYRSRVAYNECKGKGCVARLFSI